MIPCLTLLSHIAFDVAQDMVGLVACKYTLPACIQAMCSYWHPGFLFTTIPGSFFSIHPFLSMCWYQWVPWPSCRTLYLALLNFMKFPWAYLASLAISFWMTPLLSSILTTTLSCTLAEAALNHSMSSIKVLNSISLDMTHMRGTSCDSSLFGHWDVDHHLWMQLSTQILLHWLVHPPNPHLSNLEVKNFGGDSIKHLADVNVLHWDSGTWKMREEHLPVKTEIKSYQVAQPPPCHQEEFCHGKGG